MKSGGWVSGAPTSLREMLHADRVYNSNGLIKRRGGDAMALSDLTEDAVLKAMAEFDELGREQFLARYDFGSARSYFIMRDGRQYNSKAIAGVAHRFARPDEGPLTADAFSGGEATVAAWFRGHSRTRRH